MSEAPNEDVDALKGARTNLAQRGLGVPHSPDTVILKIPHTSDTPPGGLSPGETPSRTSSSPSLPTHPSSQSPAPSESQPRGETCPAPHDGPIRLVQGTFFAAFGNCTSTTASSGRATSPAANKPRASPIQAYTMQGSQLAPFL
ncbi:hypothetical protein PAXRUDRAFT_15014 [Paxillus rubicundulus Ve08.2h10]|uniref:Uncharacterized protein n=1 Tax=Paxillus rubicundulus Ve08.2h10 TaxID=930991 RepID=A0A0D0CGP3_9AGAM|nr:hypothetical protein PAXRUDRAFT_15014 [Paxillus rubicundulus Ve08.2h10]